MNGYEFTAAQAITLGAIAEAHKGDDVEILHVLEQADGAFSVAVNDSFGGSIATYDVSKTGFAIDDEKHNLTTRMNEVVANAKNSAQMATSGRGYGYSAAMNYPGREGFAVLVVTGDVAEKLRPTLDALNDLARDLSKQSVEA